MKRPFSSGMHSTIASAFGPTTKRTGSIAMVFMPSSCSLAFITAISAAIAEPARPVTSRHVSTGPSSRTSTRPITPPSDVSAPNTISTQ